MKNGYAIAISSKKQQQLGMNILNCCCFCLFHYSIDVNKKSFQVMVSNIRFDKLAHETPSTTTSIPAKSNPSAQ